MHSLNQILHRRREPGKAGRAIGVVKLAFIGRHMPYHRRRNHCLHHEIVYREGDFKQPSHLQIT